MTCRLAALASMVIVLFAWPANAQPAAPVLVAPAVAVEGSLHVFTWRARPGATWYQIWVSDALRNPRFAEWYTAAQAGCAEGTGTCAISVSMDLAAGPASWWVRAYNAGGNGPWSPAMNFVARHTATAWEVTLSGADRLQVVLAANAGVLDRETGLVWERSPSMTSMTWRNALQYCVNKTVGGRKGWRLPNVQELASLYNPAGTGFFGGLPAGHPFLGITIFALWTSTPAVEANASYIVSFTIGGNDGAFPQSAASQFPAWCVRGGAGRDVQ